MPRILIVDDTAIVRDPLAASLRLAGYETDVAANGREGLQRARAARPDLILLDTAMPEMDGLQVVMALRADPNLRQVPIILLSASADRGMILRAGQLGIRDFILKSRFSMGDMLERVRKNLGRTTESKPPAAVAAAPTVARTELPCLLKREQCLARLEKATAARPMSGIVAQVVEMAGSPTAEMADMAAMISRDPLLAARVLRVANSAALSGKKRVVATVPEAVVKIGIANVRNIATALGVFESLPAGGDDVHRVRAWQHSFATAMICQHLIATSPTIDRQVASVAYLVGLCHDLGQILFQSVFSSEYGEVRKVHAESNRPLESVEREMLGVTQMDVAQAILKRLSLPQEIRSPIEEFHSFQRHPARRLEQPLARLLSIAKPYANGMMMASSAGAEVRLLSRLECTAACGLENPAIPDIEALRGQILAMTPLLARLSPQDEADVLKPILAPTDARVCLVRDGNISAFDPVETALRSLARVDVSDSLPPDEADYQSIVVTCTQRDAISSSRPQPILRLSLDAPPASDAIEECGPVIGLDRLAAFVVRLPQAPRQAA
jgi:HD-like signal output (HDOD) protein/CheY-like chemotaxis protein